MRLCGLVVLLCRAEGTKEVELLALRYEIAVLRRQVKSPLYRPADGAWFASLSRLVCRGRWSCFSVTCDAPHLAPSAGRAALDPAAPRRGDGETEALVVRLGGSPSVGSHLPRS